MKDEEKSREQLLSELNELRLVNNGLIAQEKKLREMNTFLKNEGKIIKSTGTVQGNTERIQVKTELEKIQKLYDDVLDAIPDMVWLKDVDGVYLMCNRELAKLVNLSKEKIIGGTDYDIFPKEKADFYAEHDRKAIENRAPITNEESADYAHASYSIWIETTKIPIYNRQGGLVGVLGIGRDISKNKETLKKSREKQDFLSMVVNFSPFPMWIGSPNGITLQANQAFYSMFNLTANQIIGKYNLLLDDNFKRANIAERIGSVLHEKQSVRFDLLWEPDMVHNVDFSNGHNFYIDVSIFPLLNQNGNMTHIIVQCVDITEHKQLEDKINETKIFLENIFKTSLDGIIITDSQGTIMSGNSAMERMLGYDPGVLIGMHTYELSLHDSESNEKGKKLIEELYSEGVVNNFEHTWVRKDGGLIDIEMNMALLKDKNNNVTGAVSGIREITERKQTDEALRQSEEKYRELVESANSIILRWIPDGTITFFNEFAQKFFGFEASEIIGKNVIGSIVPETESTGRDLKQLFSDILKNPAKYEQNENENICKDGKRVWVNWTNRAIQDQNGDIIEMLTVGTDITESRKAEEELKRLAVAIGKTEDLIFISDNEGGFIYVNDSFERKTGYCKEELIDQHSSILGSDQNDKELLADMLEHALNGKVWSGHMVLSKKDGTNFDVEAVFTPLKDKSGFINSYVSVLRDVTKEIIMQRQLAQAQKMESIGTLAGGIAHDFNNILGGIIGYTELSKENTPQNSPVADYLNNVLKLTIRASDLISQILTFSRKSLGKENPIDIAAVLKEALKLLRSTLPQTIEIETNIDSFSAVVLGDPSSIHQIVMNLVTNSAHAIENDTGIIKISLTLERLDEKDLSGNKNARPGMFVKLTVQDNGSGIDLSIIPHIFDPFYTTKDIGKGTGLGLSVVHGIITAHGGVIKVNSVLNEGTTFNVFLPKTEMKDIETDVVSPQAIPGTANILFVDDEELLRDITQKTLSSLGYNVTAPSSAFEAIEIFKEDPEQFDLVITDLSMPKMNGVDLSKELIKLRPKIPVILCSGNKGNVTDQSIKDAGIRATVMKPVTKVDLSKVVFDVLNSKEK